MSGNWLRELAAAVDSQGTVVRASVVRADGSAPRGPGSAMVVGPERFTGTVGGGALELEALKVARDMLAPASLDDASDWHRLWRPFPLGPSLGQCCGGYVELLFELVTPKEALVLSEIAGDGSFDATGVVLRPLEAGEAIRVAGNPEDKPGDISNNMPEDVLSAVDALQSGNRTRRWAQRVSDWYVEPLGTSKIPLFLYGAGHVGRAVVKVLSDLPFEIFWVDTLAERYPPSVPAGVHRLISADPADAARHAPTGAWHVVMTYSHAIDFDVCQAVLSGGGFAYLGLIASKTKRVRFRRRLAEAGLSDDIIAGLHAPIGLPGLDGKEPAVIAVSLAADLLVRLQQVSGEAALPLRTDATAEALGKS